MLGPLIGVGGIFAILVVTEILWRTKVIKKPEVSRKIIHILSGTFIAFWPFFMSLGEIQVLSLLLLAVVGASKSLRFFMSIHGVGRQTFGEILFPLGVLFAATFTQSNWVFVAAILHLSLADGFAAAIGARHNKRFGYKVIGQMKTLIGTAVFYVLSLLIVAGAMILDPVSYGQNALMILSVLPLSVTVVENFAPYGTDNLFIPAFVVGALEAFKVVV
jgi:phytol kinase